MKYSEWLSSNLMNAANVKSIKSLSGSIEKEDGSLDYQKIMNMSILMISSNSENDDLEITLV